MANRITVVTDAAVDISPNVVKKYSISIVPRRFRTGRKVGSVDSKRPISEYLKILKPRERSKMRYLAADSGDYLSAYKNVQNHGNSALVILPPETADSSYEAAIAARGLLQRKRDINIIRAKTVASGLKFLVETCSAFISTESNPDIVNAFISRLQNEIRCKLIIKDRMKLSIYPEPEGLELYWAQVFFRKGWVSFTQQGTLMTNKNKKGLGSLLPGQRLFIEYSRGTQRLVRKIHKGLRGQKNVSIESLLVVPEGFFCAKSVIIMNIVPTKNRVNEISSWARHWGKFSRTD